MSTESPENHQDEADEPISESRRGFIRKAAYSAPVLIALGSLSHMQNAEALIGGSICPPPNQPGYDPTCIP